MKDDTKVTLKPLEKNAYYRWMKSIGKASSASQPASVSAAMYAKFKKTQKNNLTRNSYLASSNDD
jgi:hypothetical protein